VITRKSFKQNIDYKKIEHNILKIIIF